MSKAWPARRERGRSAPALRTLLLLVAFAALLLALGPATAKPAGGATPAQSQSTPAVFNAAGGLAGYNEPLCEGHSSLCRDIYDNPGDEYVGHDEPSLAFRSSLPGSANNITYEVRLPKDPVERPRNDGGGGTWNFELRPTFWLGLTLCDTESAPEYTHVCTPNTGANNLIGSDPSQPNYIGKHPGNAFLELQFYEPGWVPQFEGFGCSATQYCAAMTIDSFNENQNTGVFNTPACDQYVLGGPEPINWAYVTKSGISQAPADPLFTGTFNNPNLAAVNPDFSKDLMMNPGDRIRIHMHDTAAGYRVDLLDLTTGQSGSMTASIANGFAHVLYEPNAATCTSRPYAFHSEYSTANARGNTWSAHTVDVSYSDEIGHFEHCLVLDAQFNCAVPGSDDPGGLDEDDDHNACLPGQDATVVHINGCVAADEDFDGPSYQKDWPGTNPNVAADRHLHAEPVLFTSPTTAGRSYSTIQFETDLPRIEAGDSSDNPPFCDRNTGVNCVNPPPGAQFYPFYTTTMRDGVCNWQEGGNFLPGTINHFGGSSTTEFGPLLNAIYPGPGFAPIHRFNNFNSGDLANPCTRG